MPRVSRQPPVTEQPDRTGCSAPDPDNKSATRCAGASHAGRYTEKAARKFPNDLGAVMTTRTKGSTAEHLSLCVNKLSRAGRLEPGTEGAWHWRSAAGSSAITVACIDHGSLNLAYRRQGRDYQLPVRLERTPCRFGGSRSWFACPSCGRRCGKLYMQGKFVCRLCAQLNYPSQQETHCVYGQVYQYRRQRLGCFSDMVSVPAQRIPKPKSMHWRTFSKHIDELIQLERKALVQTARVIESLQRRGA